METGENGAPGAHAVKHVNKANNLGPVNATHQPLNTVERCVVENPTK